VFALRYSDWKRCSTEHIVSEGQNVLSVQNGTGNHRKCPMIMSYGDCPGKHPFPRMSDIIPARTTNAIKAMKDLNINNTTFGSRLRSEFTLRVAEL